jgi:3-oxoacyl-[acyl-carrier-protein] synthase III
MLFAVAAMAQNNGDNNQPKAGETKESNVLPVDETLHNHGNCIAASIPLGLEKLLHGGSDVSQKSVLVLGTGAGLTLGGMSIRFS